jgi:cytochrome c biogenesis protein CcdA
VLLAAALQNVWVLGAFALIFVLLALSMFGFYELQLPGFLHQRLDSAHRRLPGGQIVSVAVMGLLSAVIVSPCVAAPLAGRCSTSPRRATYCSAAPRFSRWRSAWAFRSSSWVSPRGRSCRAPAPG